MKKIIKKLKENKVSGFTSRQMVIFTVKINKNPDQKQEMSL